MFRAAQNPFDEIVSKYPSLHSDMFGMNEHDGWWLIAKATDENLTSENWELILTVCDQVDSKPEDG